MRIAIPLTDGRLSAHFGHCQAFALIDLDPGTGAILGLETATPPHHEPGVLPAWLATRDVNLVLAGGMGSRAQEIFATHGVEVIVGAPELEPRELALAYLDGKVGPGVNACDH